MTVLRASLAALAFTALGALQAQAQFAVQPAAAPAQPDIYVVMFRADYCAPCKIVEPALANALQSIADPRIEFVNIDIGAGNGSWNANAVFDRGIVAQYNMWLGVTGFAAVIDSSTKQTLGCVNMTYDQDSMASHIRNLQAAAQADRPSFDLTCPESNGVG